MTLGVGLSTKDQCALAATRLPVSACVSTFEATIEPTPTLPQLRTPMRKLVLTTIGTLGDLHPFIALGLALKQSGFAPVLAVAEDHVAECKHSGIEAVAIFPSFENVRQSMGLCKEDAVRRIMSSQQLFLEQILLPSLSGSAQALDRLATDAAAIIATPFVFAAPIIAEKGNIPLVTAVLQPMGILAPDDPPSTPDFWMTKHAPVGRLGAGWNSMVYATMRRALKTLYSRQLDMVRAEHDLAPEGAANMLEPHRRSALILGCYSKLLGRVPPNALPHTEVIGFPFSDNFQSDQGSLDPVLVEFLRTGPPPLVFTLGTFAVHSAGEFYEQAALTAGSLGLRAVMLTGGSRGAVVDGSVIRCGFVPHSLLFPHACLVVHHGGVGTTGQAMRAGKPQIIVPHMGDQHDHAYRIERLGLGLSLKVNRFTASRVSLLIQQLLERSSFRERAQAARDVVNSEDGLNNAVSSITKILQVSG